MMSSEACQVEFPGEHRWPLQLRAGGLVLRPLRRRDRQHWNELRLRNLKWLSEWDATSPPGSSPPLSFSEMVRAQHAAARAASSLPLVMCWDESWPTKSRSGSWPIIGQVTVSGITWGAARMGQIGYWIDEAFAGRGLTPRAVAIAGDYCFSVMGLHRLEINIRPENASSIRVAEKLGYRYEGLRKRYLHINHQWRDHLSFALTAEEVPKGILGRYLKSVSSQD